MQVGFVFALPLGMALLFAVNGFAQNPIVDALNPLNPNSSGVRITDVTFSSSYFSESVLGAAKSEPVGPQPALSAAMLQASATFSWLKGGEKSNFSIVYSPAYLREVPFSKYHSFNQSLLVNESRSLASKLTFTSSLQALVSDFNQLLFSSSAYGNLASTPSTLLELVSGMLTGQSANPGLSQLLSQSPVVNSPETSFLYGGREVSASASASLLYSQSPRSNFRLSLQGMRTQYLSPGLDATTGTQVASVGMSAMVPATTMGSLSLVWSYSLTPRTTFSAEVSSSRAVSSFEDAYASQITGSVGHTLNTHWFVQGTFGEGYIDPVRQTFAVKPQGEPEYGGSVGYKFGAQTLLGSCNRTVSDSYGLAANATNSALGAWNWNPPQSNFAMSAGFGYSHLTGPLLSNTSSWTAHAEISRKIRSQLFATVTYGYVQYPETLALASRNLALSGEMVGLSWSPSPVRR